MANLDYLTKVINREIRRTEEYTQYHRLKKKLSSDEKNMERIDEYRRKCFLLQTKEFEKEDQELLEKLQEEYKDILGIAAVHEFLISESRLCRMMKEVLATAAQAADLDIEL